MCRHIKPGIAVWIALCGLVATAAAENGIETYEEQMRVRLDQQAPGATGTSIDGGGWFSFAIFNYDDQQARRHRTLRKYDLRLWGAASYQDVHSAYLRVLTSYEDWNSGDNPMGYGDDYKEFEFVRAWYQFNVDEFIARQTGQEQNYDLSVRVGRQLIELGTGLAMVWPLDAIRVNAEVCDLELMGFVARSIDDYPNIDKSDPVYTHQDRWFWGLQARYTGLRGHSLFAYYLSNHDMTSPKEPDPARRAIQDYDYTSQYIGIGSEGQFVLPNMKYQVELVGETGRTHSYFQGPFEDQDDICAWALDVQLAYYFPTRMRPKVWAQYLYASGDNDRDFSTTSTAGGNRPGTVDNAFNGFGFRDTGISYAPEISNLQMWQLGGSFLPFEQTSWGKNLELGTKVYFYAKAAGGGPTDDTTIDNANSRYLGWEWDAYVDWRITSDVSVTVRYGAFQPGAAYEDSDCRQFLYAALTYSF